MASLKGPAGDTPIVGIKKDLDEQYYWTVKTGQSEPQFIVDERGQKFPAKGPTGEPGKNGEDGTPGRDGTNGVTPKFKIESDYWWVSYDNGGTWEKLGKAKGETGAKGVKGDPAIQPKFQITAGNWEVSYDKGYSWEVVGQATGDRGASGKNGRDGIDGENGKDGITPEFEILYDNWYVTYGDEPRKYLGRAIGDKGDPGNTPGLTRV